MFIKKSALLLAFILTFSVFAGCSKPATDTPPSDFTNASAEDVNTSESENETENPVENTEVSSEAYVDSVTIYAYGNEAVELYIAESEAAVPDILEPEATGTLVEQNDRVIIDYSNTADGYIMVLFTDETPTRLKAQIVGPYTTYTYNLFPGEWSVFPITDGNGSYQFKIFENISGNSYYLVLAASQYIELSDEFAPFIRPNQYVNYGESSAAVAKAQELCKGLDAPLEKVEAIYTYVVNTLSYDYEKAATVKSGYTPVLDTILETEIGICFDYAALMTGMLRSQGVPCKMVFGYAGNAYHAWISVWTDDEGWVDGAIFFDGTTWHRLDPTFASSAGQSDAIMQYIGDGSNYTEKYFY